MKNKILKISVVILLVMTLTMTNFIFLGSSIISYAADAISTNNKNIEFSAYFKNSNGEAVTSLDRTSDVQDMSMYLSINVKKEGFFTGQVELKNSNFNIVSSESEYVSKISDNTVYLNQLNAGTTAEIELKIKTIEKDSIDLNMLNCESELTLTGIYRDSREKDLEINATRTVNLYLIEANTNDSVENTLSVITNKVLKISGEDKRVVQLSLNVGLKENNYPLKQISAKIKVPEIDGKAPEVSREVNLNTMSAFEYKYENGYVEITLTNNKAEDNSVLWKKQGNENIILTYIYDANVSLENVDVDSEVKVTLQNDKELTSTAGRVILSNEEIDTAINLTAKNEQDSINKGKLYSSIEKQYTSKTTLNVNLANVEEYISIKEESSRYILAEGEADANVYYNTTTLSKESFDKVLGNDGKIQIYNENGQLIAEITNNTTVDENGNLVINYTGNEPKAIEMRTSKPIAEGKLEFSHIKTIRPSDINILKSANSIATKIVYGYNQEDTQTYTKGIEAETEISLGLNETATEAKLEINRNSLSTIIANDIEMKLILKTDDEARDLYRNPTFTIELPEQVESIQINSINLLYEDELRIANYSADGRYITIQMEGEQTSYKSQSVEGANIVINATVNVNRTSVANSEAVNVAYTNEKANAYVNNEEIGRISKAIEIVAPKDVTAINSIKALDVETIGEEEVTSVNLQRGTDSKQYEVDLEVINNNKENIQDVSILGTFPTKTDENNMDIKVVDGINIENATVYYTENEDATTDLQDSSNGWSQEITNPDTVKKYLIEMDQVDASTIVSGSYTIEIPENLEYNQTAKEGYEVGYTKAETGSENVVKATTLSMETGVGPKLETNLTATLSGEELADGSAVKSGETIKYRIQVSNVGSEDVTNVTVKGAIPEGTTLVQPVNNYEYSGASYYKGVKTDTYETTIDSLKVGEVKYVEYEVMVNSSTADGTEMTNVSEINYSDVVQETNELKLTSEAGKLRPMVKRVTNRDVDLYEEGTVKYFAIVKNTSSETLNDVTVKTNKSDNLEVTSLELITGLAESVTGDDELVNINLDELENDLSDPTDESDEADKATETDSETTEAIEYSDEINIGTLEPGEAKVLHYIFTIDQMPENQANTLEFSIIASDGEKEYKSNKWEDQVNSFDIDMTIQSNTESKYVKTGDTISYIIKAKNNSSSETSGLTIQDAIPSQLTVTNISVNGEAQAEEDGYSNDVSILDEIPANSEMTVQIDTVVDYSEDRTSAETISNKAVASVYGDEVATTSDLNHIIEADADEEEPGNGGNGNTPGGENGNVANGEQLISGFAWYDANGNGKKDDGEEALEGITVNLLNVETNQLVKTSSGDTLSATTDGNGNYVLDNIANGQYIVIFDYNKDQYSLTKYKAEGISEAENSDVNLNELLIGDSRQQVAATDIISIQNENISDISIGLIELQNFDLRLDKYVNRISIQNSAGTTVREYNNTSTAKIELDAKQMSGSTVIVEYNIIVTNVGEVAGYARSIVDYMPSDLEFNSELNKDWYESNNSLYTSALENDIINPGESRTVTLTLTKTMGEDNVVSRNNAEIYEDYNDLGIEDGNSTPGNKASGENDMGSADVIISIRTGGVIYMTIGVVIAIIVVAGATAGIIVKRKNSKSEEE